MDQLLETFNQITGSFGKPIAAILILLIGWLVAGILKKVIAKLISKTGIDKNTQGNTKFSDIISRIIYFIVMLFVFTLALEQLGMTNVLEPIKNLLSGFTTVIPNIIGAILVGYIGYMLATIISELVGFSGKAIQNFAPKLHLPANINLVTILKKVVFIFIFIPLLIAALNILNLNSVSEPATEMLQSFFEAIPKVLLAAFIIILFVVGGRFLSGLLKDLLNSFNLNEVLKSASLDSFFGTINIEKLISNIVYAFIILFGIVTAIEKLEFTKLSEMLNTVIELSGNILFGLVILAIGNWLASLAANNFMKSGDNVFVGNVIKVAILAIFLAIGLRRMGIADDIINLAFGITLGAVALTIVLSFGIGGREAAGKQMAKILDKFNK